MTAGTNTTIFGDQITLRANYAPGQDPNGAPAGGRTQAHWLNTAAFQRPAAGQLAGKSKVQFRSEVFNVFNKKNYRTIDTNMTSLRFGAVTDVEPPRIVQLGAKFTF